MLERGVKPGPAPHVVDRAESSRRHQPRPRVCWNSFLRPLFSGGGKSVMQRILGNVKVTEQTNKCSEDPARLAGIERVDGGADLVGGLLVCEICCLFHACVFFKRSTVLQNDKNLAFRKR